MNRYQRYLTLLMLATMAIVGYSCGVYLTSPARYAVSAVLFWPIGCAYLYAKKAAA